MLQEQQHSHAPTVLAGGAERPGRQRARADQLELGDAAACHGRPPATVGLVDRPAADRGHHLGGGVGPGVEQDGAHPPVDRVARREDQHLLLGRLFQPEVGEPGVLAERPWSASTAGAAARLAPGLGPMAECRSASASPWLWP